MNNSVPLLPISTVAEVLKVHQRTLRIYDEERLLMPSRSPKNRRKYSMDDIELGRLIQYLTKECGVNLMGIKIIIELMNELKVPVSKRKDFVSKIALNNLGLTKEMQEANKSKLNKRGRKKKVA